MIFRITRNGQVYGPYTYRSIQGFLREGLLSLDELAWTSGLPGWQPLGNLLSAEKREETGEEVAKIWNLVEKDRLDFAIDLLASLDDPSIYEALLEKYSLQDFAWTSNLQCPTNVDCAQGVELFLFCLSKIPLDRVPKRFREMKKFIFKSFLPLGKLLPLSKLPILTDLSIIVSEAKDEDLVFLESFPNLRRLELFELGSLSSLSFLEGMTGLEDVRLEDFRGRDLNPLASLVRLEHLSLNNFHELRKIPRLECKSTLESADFSKCRRLVCLEGLSQYSQLKTLDLSQCDELSDVSPLEDCPSLESLDLSHCTSVMSEGPLSKMDLRYLFLEGCPLHLKFLGRKLRASKARTFEVIWDGSGDDGYFERFAHDGEGNEIKGEEVEGLLGMAESFTCSQLPGGAEINSGSRGTMTFDCLAGSATWDFSWNDGNEPLRDLCEALLTAGQHRLRVELYLHIEPHVLASSENWENYHALSGFFYEDVELKLVSAHSIENVRETPVELGESLKCAFESLFQDWDMAYGNEGDMEEVMSELLEEAEADLPESLLEHPIVIEVDAMEERFEFRRHEKSRTVCAHKESEVETFLFDDKE